MIQFRPHHFMCTLGFKGKGYSLGFIKNYKAIVERLINNPDLPIQVTTQLDTICGSCPHQTHEKLCDKQSLIEHLDKAHQDILGLENGQIVSWAAAKKIIKANMTIPKFHKACDGCSWKDYGVCEEALSQLTKEQ